MKIHIETIPHHRQRYDSCGDYWVDGEGTLQIRVSATGDWREEFLIALHELIEKALCVDVGITDEEVDEFDMTWVPHDLLDEPGDDPEAPYHQAHFFATRIEKDVAVLLGVKWAAYAKRIASLDWRPDRGARGKS